MRLHGMWSGYAILALVLFRILWGFVGGEYARYGSFHLSSPGRVSVRQKA